MSIRFEPHSNPLRGVPSLFYHEEPALTCLSQDPQSWESTVGSSEPTPQLSPKPHLSKSGIELTCRTVVGKRSSSHHRVRWCLTSFHVAHFGSVISLRAPAMASESRAWPVEEGFAFRSPTLSCGHSTAAYLFAVLHNLKRPLCCQFQAFQNERLRECF
ncbi:hypothetical protein HJG60_011591 [Phyllostomus discolor]|uniref:Uncharacterized protein n=1 Tax=Phyllostomus discolor TaxID=89673 RepID=A0A833ZU22_9CHIR|nr:hypothetical protein HJG60_011591 [Phyllostomus discolor]